MMGTPKRSAHRFAAKVSPAAPQGSTLLVRRQRQGRRGHHRRASLLRLFSWLASWPLSRRWRASVVVNAYPNQRVSPLPELMSSASTDAVRLATRFLPALLRRPGGNSQCSLTTWLSGRWFPMRPVRLIAWCDNTAGGRNNGRQRLRGVSERAGRGNAHIHAHDWLQAAVEPGTLLDVQPNRAKPGMC